MSTPEGRIKAKVSRWLNELGMKCWYFMPVQSGFGRPALDYEGGYNGLAFAIETKAPGGEMTPTQKQTRDGKLAAGYLVFLIYDDETLNLAKEVFDGIRVTWDDGHAGRVSYLTTHAAALWEQHRDTTLKSGKAPKPAAGGDHGASGRAPQRHAQPRSR